MITILADTLYSSLFSIYVSLLVLSVIGLLVWMGKGRQVVLGLSLLLAIRYFAWRGLYTLNTADFTSALLSWTVYLAEAYGVLQFIFFAYQASPLERSAVPLTCYPTVDMFVTVVNEPVYLLKRTLIGCLHQDYPPDKVNVYVLDDGSREEVKSLAASLGCRYLRRADRSGAKAGNINHALGKSSSEFVALFDVDHVPVRTFLRETLGFFQDEQVAFVQTRNHFYNADLFQNNLRLEHQIVDEQALFFRAIEPGRDRHNSAFCTGTGVVFRRCALDAIGGFQTETITEDMHTSLMLHAKGYKSCYLNKALSAGGMPGTFEGYLTQRKRWATGAVQTLFRANPLTLPGLTLPQRVTYFAGIYYFFFGFSRIVYLVTPLAMLWFGIPVVLATASEWLHLFLASYLASVFAIWVVSGKSRNAFWSDVYETAMCFALTRAVLKTVMAPRKKVPFEVTPKGQHVEKSRGRRLSCVFPHLVLLSCLVVGILMGMYQMIGPTASFGLGIGLYWAASNVLLLTAVVVSARNLPQRNEYLRLKRRRPCEVLNGTQRIVGATRDLDEGGAGLLLDEPLHEGTELVWIVLTLAQNEPLVLEGKVVRQEPQPTGHVEVGVRFVNIDEKLGHALVRELYSHPDSWTAATAGGLIHSCWSLLRGVGIILIAMLRKRFPKEPAPKVSSAPSVITPGVIIGCYQPLNRTLFCSPSAAAICGHERLHHVGLRHEDFHH